MAGSFREFLHDALMNYRVRELFPKDKLKLIHLSYLDKYPQFETFLEARLPEVMAYAAAQYMFGGANAEERAKRAYEAVRYLDNMNRQKVDSLKPALVYIAENEKDV
jgi:hypothetical protein